MQVPIIDFFTDKNNSDLINNFQKSESECVKNLFNSIKLSDEISQKIQNSAIGIVNLQREITSVSAVKKLIQQYDLSNQEGIALMCMAEALLRIPDNVTRDNLIENQLLKGNWEEYLKQSDSMFVNAATWGMMITGKVLSNKNKNKNNKNNKNNTEQYESVLKKTLKKSSKPVIRGVVKQMMKIMGEQFVMSEHIKPAIKRAHKTKVAGYSYSYDMLGEGARTEQIAEDYFDSYLMAIEEIGKANKTSKRNTLDGISIKLSALHSRYELNQYEKVHGVLYDRLKKLVHKAKEFDLQVTVDAEEVARLELSLSVLERLWKDPDFADYANLGLAVQAYQKRAFYVLDFLLNIAKKTNKKIPVRLVKGAYWDTEIKLSQENGYEDYPLFTRKAHTDISYMACANKILDNIDLIYPQFATHNAHTIAFIRELVIDKKISTDKFEYQCLHGLGDSIYESWLLRPEQKDLKCRVYSPVGVHEDLLAYLVRRLLENGANSSFLNKMNDKDISSEDLVADPLKQFAITKGEPHASIPLPRDIYPDRKNSFGDNLFYANDLINIDKQAKKFPEKIDLKVKETPIDKVDEIVKNAKKAFVKLHKTDVNLRAEKLNKLADLLNENRVYLYELMIQEAGKTLQNAIGEVREAIDFCRYYALSAQELMGGVQELAGPTGETNYFKYTSCGVIVSISPWNFPLAIFLGGVTAALAAGNTVVAKPSNQTQKIAEYAVGLCHEAGFDKHDVQGVYGSGRVHGGELIKHPDTAGIMFTGSTQVAKTIQQGLASREGAILPLIAETGGLNMMVVDSSALLEQVTDDVIMSAFDSAGQRCSALRILLVQEDIYEPLKNMIVGAMKELEVGNPGHHKTDVGPVIDDNAFSQLESYVKSNNKKIVYQTPINCKKSDSVYKRLLPPTLLELKSLDEVKEEVFGPILHILSYKEKDFEKLISDINSKGYGLTVGMHSRIDSKIEYLCENIECGNIYINRNIIGAVVGVQPFGGQGLSGTGPKAGGPNYLRRILHEKVISNNITASGGNAKLMLLGD